MSSASTFDYLKQSFFFFRVHVVSLTQILIPFVLLQSLFAVFMLPEEPTIDDLTKLALLNLILLPFYQAALIRYMDAVVNDAYLTPIQALIIGLPSILPLVAVYVLMGVALATGLLLFIVPAIALMYLLSYCEFICVLEKKNPFECIDQSIRRGLSAFFPLFTGKTFIFLVLISLQILVLQILNTLGMGGVIADIASDVIFSVLFSINTIFGYRLYCVDKAENNRT